MSHPTLHQADRACGACWRRGNALWGVPGGEGAFHAVGAAADAGCWKVDGEFQPDGR